MFMFTHKDKSEYAKAIAIKYVNNKYKNDFTDCEIVVEDDGVFWVIIIDSNIDNIGYIQVIIKKKFAKVIKCFNFKKPTR